MQENYHKWYTQYLSRDFEMLVFGHSGFPIILFPTSCSRYYDTKDHGLIESAAEFIDSGKIKIYCPDEIDGQSWYNYSISPADRVKTHMAYERIILHDVIEFAKYETESKTVGVAGASFGGYHALNIAFKYPDKVSLLISMSGSFDIKPHIYGYYDDNCYFNNPVDYISNLKEDWYLDRIKKMKIILGTGDEDFALEENKYMSLILSQKEIPHTLDIRSNVSHEWLFWRQMFPEYLSNIL